MHGLLFLIFALIEVALSQNINLIQVRYVPQAVPNSGFLEGKLFASSSSGNQPSFSWYKICNSTQLNSKNILTSIACTKFGYSTGISYVSTNGPCLEVHCVDSTRNANECQVAQRLETLPVLSVTCYSDKGWPLTQQPPFSSQHYSVNCDFDYGITCNWALSYVKSLPARFVYASDATAGTSEGGLLVSDCPLSNILLPPTISSPLVENSCLGLTDYCFVFFTVNSATSSTEKLPLLNISVQSDASTELWSASLALSKLSEWSRNEVNFKVQPPFRIRLQTADCNQKQSTQIFFDGFMLTTGRCPADKKSFCFNDGTVENLDGDDVFCRCHRSNTFGRWCELVRCGGIRISDNMIFVIMLISISLLY